MEKKSLNEFLKALKEFLDWVEEEEPNNEEVIQELD